jgi:hypothetical protein
MVALLIAQRYALRRADQVLLPAMHLSKHYMPSFVGTAVNSLHLQQTLSALKKESQADKGVIERLQLHISNLQHKSVWPFANR